MVADIKKALAAILILCAPAPLLAVSPYADSYISTGTGIQVNRQSGNFNLAASSMSYSTFTITLQGTNGAIMAATGFFTGKSTYSLVTSSGIKVAAGGVTWPDGSISTTAFSGAGGSVVAASSLTVNAQQFTSTAPLTLNGSSVTLQGNAFNGSNQLVQTNSSGFLPILNGSLVTNIAQANVTGLTATLSAIGTSTAALSASTTSLQNQISSIATSTANIQGQLNSLAASTTTLNLSTVSLQNQITNFNTAIGSFTVKGSSFSVGGSKIGFQVTASSISLNLPTYLQGALLSTPWSVSGQTINPSTPSYNVSISSTLIVASSSTFSGAVTLVKSSMTVNGNFKTSGQMDVVGSSQLDQLRIFTDGNGAMTFTNPAISDQIKIGATGDNVNSIGIGGVNGVVFYGAYSGGVSAASMEVNGNPSSMNGDIILGDPTGADHQSTFEMNEDAQVANFNNTNVVINSVSTGANLKVQDSNPSIDIENTDPNGRKFSSYIDPTTGAYSFFGVDGSPCSLTSDCQDYATEAGSYNSDYPFILFVNGISALILDPNSGAAATVANNVLDDGFGNSNFGSLTIGGSFSTDSGFISTNGSGLLGIGGGESGLAVEDYGIFGSLTFDGFVPTGLGLIATSGLVFAANGIFSSTLTVQGTAFSVGGPTTFAVNSGSLIMSGTETVKGNAFSVGNSSFTVKGGSATVAYGMTAGSFSGNGASLTNLSTAAYTLPADVAKTDVSNTFTSTQTITANAFSVGGSTFVVNGSTVIIGGISQATKGDNFEVQGGSATVAGIFHIGRVYPSATQCLTATTCIATCPAGTYVDSCGGSDGTITTGLSGCYASSSTQCTCDATAVSTLNVNPVCSRIQ